MIGDWCKMKFPFGITSFTEKVGCINLSYGIEYEPIPITAEILEKNGFTKDENCGYCVWLDKHLIAVNLDTHNLAVESILIADEVQIADNYIHIQALPIHYVHELQHALRLCGLNDLADNFKILDIVGEKKFNTSLVYTIVTHKKL